MSDNSNTGLTFGVDANVHNSFGVGQSQPLLLQKDFAGLSSQQLLNLAGEGVIEAWQNKTAPTQALVYAVAGIFGTDFEANAQIAFGEKFDIQKAKAFGADILGGNYGVLPDFQFIDSTEINGGYAQSLNTVFFDNLFVSQNAANPNAVGKVLVQELAHRIDALASPVDSMGDEGKILAKLVNGEKLSPAELTSLKTEDDHNVINIGGQQVAVEMDAVSGTASITISASDNSAEEVTGRQTPNPGQFTLTRSGNISSALTAYYTVGGTATNAIDYDRLTGSVTFAAGSAIALVDVKVFDDSNIEGSESVVLTLNSNAAYTMGSSNSASINITDNDLPTITINANDSVSAEVVNGKTQNLGQFTLVRNGSTANSLTVYYTIGGTATNGVDYNNLPGNVTFAAGSFTALVNLNAIDDADFEGFQHENVILTLKSDSAYLLGVSNSATAVIVENDVPSVTITANDNIAREVIAGQIQDSGQFTFTRTGNTDSLLTAYYTIGGTANSADYSYRGVSSLTGSVTFNAGSATALVNLNVVDDADFEGEENVVLTLNSSSAYTVGSSNSAFVNIIDNDLSTITISANDYVAAEVVNGQTQNPGQFTLTRTGNISSALTAYYTIGGTATNGADYNNLTESVTFAAGSATALVNLNPIDDADFEGYQHENIVLTLKSNSAYLLGVSNSATALIVDNDLPTVTINASDNTAREVITGQTQDSGQFTLTRTGNTNSLLTAYYTISGTANSADYSNNVRSTLGGIVTFAVGAATALVDINVFDDFAVEGNENVVLTLSSNSAYTVGLSNSAAVTIVDNDLPTITISAKDNSAKEVIAGQTQNSGQFTLTRNGSTTSDLTVYYTTSGTATNGADYSNLTGSVTFAAGSSTALVNLTPIDDANFEGVESAILTLSADAAYIVGSSNSAVVNIFENDLPSYLDGVTLADALVLSLGTTYTGQLSDAKAGDFYRIDLNQATSLHFSLTGMTSPFNWRLVREDSQGITPVSLNGGIAISSYEIDYPQLSGTYYLYLSNFTPGASTNYSLNVSAIQQPEESTQIGGGTILFPTPPPSPNNWTVSYFNTQNLNDTPVYSQTLSNPQNGNKVNFAFDWGVNAPNSYVSQDNFSARVTGISNLEAGEYRITVSSDDGIRVRANQKTVIDKWIDQGMGSVYTGNFITNGGDVPIEVDYYENAGYAGLNFLLERIGNVPSTPIPTPTPVPTDPISSPNPPPTYRITEPVDEAQEWRSDIYSWDRNSGSTPPVDFYDGGMSNANWIGTLNLGSNNENGDNSGSLNFDWGNGTVKGNPNLPTDGFAIRAYTWADFDGSDYKFTVRGDDGYQILAKKQGTGEWFYITPKDQWQTQGYGVQSNFSFKLPAGRYDLHFHYFENGGEAKMDLSWNKVTTSNPVGDESTLTSGGDDLLDLPIDSTSANSIVPLTINKDGQSLTIDVLIRAYDASGREIPVVSKDFTGPISTNTLRLNIAPIDAVKLDYIDGKYYFFSTPENDQINSTTWLYQQLSDQGLIDRQSTVKYGDEERIKGTNLAVVFYENYVRFFDINKIQPTYGNIYNFRDVLSKGYVNSNDIYSATPLEFLYFLKNGSLPPQTSSSSNQGLHDFLSVLGFVPVIGIGADAINSVWYLLEGNNSEAALSSTALIPLYGDGAAAIAKGSKFLPKAVNAAEKASYVSTALTITGRLEKLAYDAGTKKYLWEEAKSILQAEKLGYVKNVRRPVLTAGEANLDFVQDLANGSKKYLDVKTPVSPNLRPIQTQVEDVLSKGAKYPSDVDVIVDLKFLNKEEGNTFKNSFNLFASSKGYDTKKYIFIND